MIITEDNSKPKYYASIVDSSTQDGRKWTQELLIWAQGKNQLVMFCHAALCFYFLFQVDWESLVLTAAKRSKQLIAQ